MKMIRTAPLLAVIASAFVLAACGKKEEAPKPVVTPAPAPAPVVTAPPPVAPAGISVSSVSLGNQVDAAQNVTMTAKQFSKTDTIYAAVATNGAASNAVLVARWTFGDGQLVDESSQTIAPTGPAVTTFHVAKPDGWPSGNYKVEVTLDGKPAGSQAFSIP